MSPALEWPSVRETVARLEERLAVAGISHPRVEAEWLVAAALECSRPALWLDSGRRLTPVQAERLERWGRQRGERIPLQHLTGRAPFLDLDLRVTPAVLIPRPETELLALRASEWLAKGPATGPTRVGAPRVLDFATGSGCLALALAGRHPEARVYALDLSRAALDVARRNASELGLSERVSFHEGDGFNALPREVAHHGFDLIVTNPPYIPTGEIAGLEPEVRDHDPRLALDGGADGLVFYRRLASEAGRWLRAGGYLMAEFGDGQGADLRRIFGPPGWVHFELHADLTGRERFFEVAPGT